MRRRAPLSIVLALASCGTPPAPVTIVAVEPAPTPAAPSGPCVDAAALRERVKGLLAAGRLDRTLRVIARADKLCPATAAESKDDRAAAQAELDREPGADGDELYRKGLDAKRAGDAAAAQRLFDRAIVAMERAARAVPGSQNARIGLDAPNGVIGDIHGVVWCSAGKSGCLAVAHDNQISVYDAGTWRERYTIDAGEKIYSLALSPDGRTLASTTISDLQIWDLERGQPIARVKGAGDEVVWSQDGGTLISAHSYDSTLDVWAAAERRQLRTIAVPAPPAGKEAPHLHGLAVSAEGKTIAASFTDGSVKLWRSANGAEIRTIRADPKRVQAIALSPDGKLVATAGSTGVRVWSAATGKEVRHLTKDYCVHLAFRSDGHALFAATVQALSSWDPETGRQLASRTTDGTGRFAFEPNGPRIAAAGRLSFEIWDPASGRTETRIERHAQAVQSAAWAPGGSMFVTGHWDEAIRIWDAQKGTLARTIPDEDSVMAVAVSPDGKSIASGTTKPSMTLWSAETGERVHAFPTQDGWTNAVTFGRSGKVLAWSTNKTATLADVSSHRVLGTFGPLTDEISSLALSPTEDALAVGTQGSKLHLFDVAAGRETASLPLGNTVSSLAFGPDGAMLLAAENNTLVFERTGPGLKLVHEIADHDGYVGAVAFRADGKLAAAGSSHGVVISFDPAAGEAARRFEGHADLVRAVSFRPDGKWLLSASDDGSIRLWPLERGRPLVLRAVAGGSDAYAFLPGADGRVELFGDAARAFLTCQVGLQSYPFDLCEERFEVRGLLGKVLAGDESYLDP